MQGRHSSFIKNKSQEAINWKKEFRIASFIQERLRSATFVASHRAKFVSIDNNRIKGLQPAITFITENEGFFIESVSSVRIFDAQAT